MRTKINGGWVVGHNGNTHVLYRDGVVVFEGNQILEVGKNFDGQVDQEIDAHGMLVAPGFIDMHVHAGHRASHRLITDTGRPDYFGQPFLEISVPKAGKQPSGDPRYVRPDQSGAVQGNNLHATFTVAELLRNGVTTFMEIGSQLRVQEALMLEVERLGIRAYLGPGFDSGRWVGDAKGRLTRVIDEEAGWREFEGAVNFIKQYDGQYGDRVRGILIPREVETCTLDLLRETRKVADELKVPISTHAAYNVIEFFQLVMEHRMTPIELLSSVGLLGPDLTIGHGNFVAENPQMNFSGGQDLELMGDNGVSISHCPVNIARRGRCLDSWERYRKAKVNIALGSDTYPRDFMMQMRVASYFGKVIGHNLKAASAAEVFEAATIGGAKALGRDDLGRLAHGTRADIIGIDLTGGGTLRYGPVRDPIKSVVECGIGDDVRLVVVDGVIRMQDGQIPGVDLLALREEAQSAGEIVWDNLKDWDALERTADEMSPWSFPLIR